MKMLSKVTILYMLIVYTSNRMTFTKASLTAELEQRRLQDDKVASELRMKEDVLRKLSLKYDESQQMVQNRNQELEKLMHEHRANRQELEGQIEILRVENESKLLGYERKLDF